MPEGSFYRDIQKDIVRDALAKRYAGNWAAKVITGFQSLGLPASVAPDASLSVDKSSFSNKSCWQST